MWGQYTVFLLLICFISSNTGQFFQWGKSASTFEEEGEKTMDEGETEAKTFSKSFQKSTDDAETDEETVKVVKTTKKVKTTLTTTTASPKKQTNSSKQATNATTTTTPPSSSHKNGSAQNVKNVSAPSNAATFSGNETRSSPSAPSHKEGESETNKGSNHGSGRGIMPQNPDAPAGQVQEAQNVNSQPNSEILAPTQSPATQLNPATSLPANPVVSAPTAAPVLNDTGTSSHSTQQHAANQDQPPAAQTHEVKTATSHPDTAIFAPTSAPEEHDVKSDSNKTTPHDDGVANQTLKTQHQAPVTPAQAPDVKNVTPGPVIVTSAPPNQQHNVESVQPNLNPGKHGAENPLTTERPLMQGENPKMEPDKGNVQKPTEPAPVAHPATPSPHPLQIQTALPTTEVKKGEGEVLSSELLEEIRKIGLEKINSYRAKHKAKPLTLTPKLNEASQAWTTKVAAEGHKRHSCVNGACDYGENAASEPPHMNFTGAMLHAVQAWYDEVSLYDFGKGGPISNGVVGHFTQLVWAGSTEVGLGAARTTTDKFIFIFAQFLPAGNYDGEYIENVFPPVS